MADWFTDSDATSQTTKASTADSSSSIFASNSSVSTSASSASASSSSIFASSSSSSSSSSSASVSSSSSTSSSSSSSSASSSGDSFLDSIVVPTSSDFVSSSSSSSSSSLYQVSDGELKLRSKELTAIPADLAKSCGAFVTTLDLTNNAINSGKGLDGFFKLQTLIMDKNKLTSISDFPVLTSLETLWINNNNIADLSSLCDVIVKNFPNITYLSMLKNPACPNMYWEGEAEAYQRYRHYVIYRLPRLKMLDASEIDSEEAKEAARVGKFCEVARPSVKEDDDTKTSGVLRAQPSFKPNKQPKVATFLGKGKPRYDGSNSEGNRFICNEDL
eukprot:TRINITY_DN2_c3_g1_i2.p1 TRINITY_DN2_c3_g1~~TRINITY_DN2_c3_g1_i2.p1  ORF type:complete len:331 (-),score=131.31 TRINITY_DN2_c3_g1_i2:437-1429(-)